MSMILIGMVFGKMQDAPRVATLAARHGRMPALPDLSRRCSAQAE
jgi:hypothetical protein